MKYIKYLLNDIVSSDDVYEEIKLVTFIVEENNVPFNLKFFIAHSSQSKWGNFDLYLDLEDTKRNINNQKIGMHDYERVHVLQQFPLKL